MRFRKLASDLLCDLLAVPLLLQQGLSLLALLIL